MPNTKPTKKGALDVDISIGGINFAQKVTFAKHLAVMLKSGLTITEALEIVYGQAEGKLRKIIGKIKTSVDAGNSLSSSLGKFPKIFPPIFVNTVYVGESSGTLDENLDNLAGHLKKDKELLDKIKGAMVYPMIVLSLAFVLAMAISFVVLPKITPLFKGLGMDLPLSTKVLIAFSDIIQKQGKILFPAIVGSVIFIVWIFRQNFFKPVADYLILHTPIIKHISRNKNLTIFSSTLGTLLKSGLNIDEALRITKDTIDNYYYKRALDDLAKKAQLGTKISENLSRHKKYFPSLMVSMVKIGENSGRLEEVLAYLADYYETEVNNATKTLSTAIEPLLLIFIGLMVGGLAIAIITPIYKMTGNVQK